MALCFSRQIIYLLLVLLSSSPIFSPAGITGKDDLTVGAITSGRVNFYPWTIDNKYYCAEIHLCVVPNTFHVTAEIAEAVQAFVVYFDSTTVRALLLHLLPEHSESHTPEPPPIPSKLFHSLAEDQYSILNVQFPC